MCGYPAKAGMGVRCDDSSTWRHTLAPSSPQQVDTLCGFSSPRTRDAKDPREDVWKENSCYFTLRQSKEPACNNRDTGSIPGWGKSPGGGHGNLLQYSCLENPMDRGAWRDTVHGVEKSWTRLSD